ncbi:hypothetical protein HY642_00370 [Candidatus Woesearchaeota archaeon]|nr:hypothetical protein [Candidatus Woesearchaeota archaeon]
MTKMLQRQALITTVKELRKLADSLEWEEQKLAREFKMKPIRQRHLVAIINKSATSDTWRFEH